MEVSDHHHASSALPREAKKQVPPEQGASWVPEPVSTFWRKEQSLAPGRIRTLNRSTPSLAPYIDCAAMAPKAKRNNSNPTLRRQHKVMFVTEMLHTFHRPMFKKKHVSEAVPAFVFKRKGKERCQSGWPVIKT